ncbi:DUF2815 family protein [Hyphomicrobium sp. xq]|uniref:DUF2815 family protein n=1 Tax=Hyphomicrobium album TaxID=2665159 RepID=A0A6I3KEC6_9HYPH|nr:DUF2815 family protein [Hyphomicrobium album]MTD92898.1 DUF2815 family protein [Hyphomicrobium album]
MAEAKKAKRPLVTTPKGRFKFPHLIVPDTKYDKDGKFHVQLVLDEKSAAPLIKQFAPEHKAAIASAKEEYDEMAAEAEKLKKKMKVLFNPQDFFTSEVEDGEPTGNVVFTFGTKAKLTVKDKSGKDRVIQRVIPVFDAKGQRINGSDLSIWGGTLGKVSFFAQPYFIPGSGLAGLSFRLAAVQVIELVSGGGRSAGGFGFGQEDGFEYEPKDNGPDVGDEEPLDDEIPF